MYASGLDASDTAAAGTVVDSQRSISGQAQFRFVQTAPSAGTVDVYLTSPGQPISDASPILANGALLSSSSVNLTPGSYDLFVTRSGTTVQLFGPDRISVDAGAVYSARTARCRRRWWSAAAAVHAGSAAVMRLQRPARG